MSLIPSGSQTVGPFFNFALTTDRALGTLARDGVQGERIRLEFRVTDGDGAPTPGDSMIELWQADAGGVYDGGDPNFLGAGRAVTDEEGNYRFLSIKPGAYPWRNHRNAWRPAHIHFSLFGTEFTQRMVTQMYFPGDPLFALDPIYQSVVDPAARARLVATYDHELTQPEWCTGYRWDIVLTGAHRTLMEADQEVDR